MKYYQCHLEPKPQHQLLTPLEKGPLQTRAEFLEIHKIRGMSGIWGKYNKLGTFSVPGFEHPFGTSILDFLLNDSFATLST